MKNELKEKQYEIEMLNQKLNEINKEKENLIQQKIH
jgi:hypothetical protein